MSRSVRPSVVGDDVIPGRPSRAVHQGSVRDSGRAWSKRWVAGTLLVAVAFFATTVPAAADEPGESDEASVLVRQAIVFAAQESPDPMKVLEKVEDALEVDNQEGVDIALVAEARDVLDAGGDVKEARALLERSIGAVPASGDEPNPIGHTPTGATGAEPGEELVADPLPGDRDVDGGDAALLAVSGGLVAIGVWLALRYRPRPSAATS